MSINQRWCECCLIEIEKVWKQVPDETLLSSWTAVIRFESKENGFDRNSVHMAQVNLPAKIANFDTKTSLNLKVSIKGLIKPSG